MICICCSLVEYTILIYVFVDKYQSQFSQNANQYAYFHDDDDSSYKLVEKIRERKPVFFRGRGRFPQVPFLYIMLMCSSLFCVSYDNCYVI